jgi:colanic acid/amylovoran biosynthesis protein
MLTIEVLGIGFPNKGAELMLLAISEWAARLPVESRLAVRWDTRFEDRLRHKLWAKVWHSVSARLPYGHFVNRWPESVVRRLGVVRERDVDVFMDASGYAYGDSWGAAKARDRLGSRISAWRRQGSSVVLLPQAFGPFETPALRVEMQRILSQADRIYARDEASLANLRQLAPGSSSVARGYDFTCLVSPQPFRGMEALEGVVGLIPNHKMYSQVAGIDRAAYVDYFIRVARGLLANGQRPVLILHEGLQDQRICEEIKAAVGDTLDIVALTDPREIKMAIGMCSSLLTSRFHGFASGLFQGVPSLATSWSHKYKELARDFDAAELVLEQLEPEETVNQLTSMSAAGRRSQLRAHLIGRAEGIKEQTKRMWRDIEALIDPARIARRKVGT